MKWVSLTLGPRYMLMIEICWLVMVYCYGMMLEIICEVDRSAGR
jgi:hypothetical protein